MNVVSTEGKTKEAALNNLLEALNASEFEVAYSFTEKKGGLFKGTVYECKGFLKLDIIEEVEKFLKTLIKGMNMEIELEVLKDNDTTTIRMYSSNNPLLIGKNGQNLEALSTIVRQYVKNITPNGPKIILDVEDYKDRQNKKIERLAKNLAREVLKTKVDVEMDNMNSYERRIVHNALSSFKDIKTESIGEEPNRHVVIKYMKG